MKLSFKHSITITLLIWSLSACELGDFGDINISPNSPSAPNTAAMMTAAMRDIAHMSSDMMGGLYAQHFGDVTYIEESRYKTLYFDFSGGFFVYSPPL